jgi:hypothetical protein
MIVSRRFGYIFLKTARTAGTSTEIALSRFAGPDDIISPIMKEDEILRRREGGCGPQHHHARPGQPAWQGRLRTLLRRGHCLFRNHMSAQELRPLLPEQLWNDSFRFCVERNPFDRAISLYYWCCRRGEDTSLDEFLESPRLNLLIEHGRRIYLDDAGELLVHRVLRYEHLACQLEELRQELGIPQPIRLPYAKSECRRDRRHYSEVLSNFARRRIESLFEPELQRFGYRY